MVKSILDESKTQTRRIIKPQPDFDSAWKNLTNIGGLVSEAFLNKKMEGRNIPQINLSGYHLGVTSSDGFGTGICTPNIRVKVHKGDIFWVRETWQFDYHWTQGKGGFVYKSDFPPKSLMLEEKWKPSIFMPKEACRIFLKVANVRVERLHDISEEDAKAEGVERIHVEIAPSPHNDMAGGFDYAFVDYMHRGEYAGWGGDAGCCRTAKESFFTLWESINGKESLESNPLVWVYDFERIEKPDNF